MSEQPSASPSSRSPSSTDGSSLVPRWLTFAALGSIPAWAVSLVLHSLGVTALLMVTLNPLASPKVLNLTVVEAVDEEEDVTNMEFDFEPELEDMEVESAAPQLLAEAAALSTIEPDPSIVGEMVSAEDLAKTASAQFDGLDADGLMTELSGIGDGFGSGASFFGTGAKGERICFLVDNSISMGGGRLETALVELERSIRRLAPSQKFFIIFYSDTAYPLFYPESAEEMVEATGENKRKVEAWLKTIEMCNFTNGRDAIAMALEMEPDLVYILGDGAFTDGSDNALAKMKLPGITIHTLGMHVKPIDVRHFAAMAAAHGGTYKDVGITAYGRQRFLANGPIRSHRKQEGIWGLKLPK